MTYLLDSDWLIDFLAGRIKAVDLVRALLPSGLRISVITYIEVLHGIRGGRNPLRDEAAFAEFLQAVELLELTHAVGIHAVDIRLNLRGQKRQINERALDILIAATAIEHGLVLVARNTRHYADIPGLQLYQMG